MSGCVTDKDLAVINERMAGIESKQVSIQSKITKIDDSVSNVDKVIETKEKGLRSGYAGLIAEETKLKNKILELGGELERAFYNIEKLNKKIGDLEKDYFVLGNRINSLEKYLDFEKGSEKRKEAAVKDKAVKDAAESKEDSNEGQTEKEGEKFDPQNADPDEIYKNAKKEFDSGHLDKSLELFTIILDKYENSGKADNAAFWIGEVYYRKGEYKRAIVTYQNVIEKFSKGNKVPAAYLKQGLAFTKIGRKENAKTIFETLISKFPGSNEALIAKRKLSNL